jgi:hypothetical protein
MTERTGQLRRVGRGVYKLADLRLPTGIDQLDELIAAQGGDSETEE